MDQERLYKLIRAADDEYPALTICYCRHFLANNPDDHVVWIYLGRALVELARYDEARTALLKALELWPEERRQLPMAQLGHLYLEAGNVDRAADWYRQAIRADPRDASYYIYLGGLMAKQGRLRTAEKYFRIAATCGDGCIDEAFLNLGYVLRAQERFSEAAECFREAVRRTPNYQEADEALQDVQRCIDWSTQLVN